MARSCPLRVYRDPSRWFDIDEAVSAPVSDFDIVLMRKDPPFDMEYVYSTYLLERAEREGTLVVNRCQSLRDCNEKLFATEFSDCCPPLIVSRSMAKLGGFTRNTTTSFSSRWTGWVVRPSFGQSPMIPMSVSFSRHSLKPDRKPSWRNNARNHRGRQTHTAR